jgi:hypothetical protein
MTDGLSRGTSAPNSFQSRPSGVPFVVDLTDTRANAPHNRRERG